MNPTVPFRVLLLSPNAVQRTEETRELSRRGLSLLPVDNLEDARKALQDDGSIHVVLSELRVPRQSGSSESVEGETLFRAFLSLRYEVSLFLYTAQHEFSQIRTCGLLNGYFCKNDQDYDDMVKKIQAEVSAKSRAPFYETLVSYARMAKDSWHTPGHSSGYSIKNSPYAQDYYEFFGENLFMSDVSVSVPMLDSLLHPMGVIKEAQDLAARAFNARHTFFSTNGTSTSNKVLLQTLLKPGDAILLDRNCHKSVHYGVIIAGAEPLYLMPSINNRYGIFGPVPKQRIFSEMDKALKAGKRLKVIILTNSTYDGLVYDLPEIVAGAHERGIKVIIDEAWYGYANFHPAFFPCAMQAGADYATQSTHKTMSAFSQASMIHVQDPDFEQIREFFVENFNMHTSTSPQYPMIASLDVARKQMVMEGYSLLQRTLDLSASFRRSINALKRFRVLELDDLITEEVREDGIRLDPTKVTIDISQTGMTSREVEQILHTKHNIQIEKSTFNTISVLITIGSTYSKLNRLVLALENIERMSGSRSSSKAQEGMRDFKLALSPIRFRPRFAFYCDGESVPLRNATGRVAIAMVTPYPPGIPLLVPGQLITQEIVDALMSYRDYGVEIHGMEQGLLKVMTPAEEETLSGQGLSIIQEQS